MTPKRKKWRPYKPRPRSRWRGVKRNMEYLRAYEEAIVMADIRKVQGRHERPLNIGVPDLQRIAPGRYHRRNLMAVLKRLKAQGLLRATTASRFAGQTYCIREVEMAYLAKHQQKGAA